MSFLDTYHQTRLRFVTTFKHLSVFQRVSSVPAVSGLSSWMDSLLSIKLIPSGHCWQRTFKGYAPISELLFGTPFLLLIQYHWCHSCNRRLHFFTTDTQSLFSTLKTLLSPPPPSPDTNVSLGLCLCFLWKDVQFFDSRSANSFHNVPAQINHCCLLSRSQRVRFLNYWLHVHSTLSLHGSSKPSLGLITTNFFVLKMFWGGQCS